MGLGLESLVIVGIGGADESKRMIGIVECSSEANMEGKQFLRTQARPLIQTNLGYRIGDEKLMYLMVNCQITPLKWLRLIV